MQTLPLEEVIKLQAKGLITIPKKFREALALQENHLLKIKKDKEKLIIEPIRVIPYKVRTYTQKDIEEFIAFDKEETKKLKKSKKIK